MPFESLKRRLKHTSISDSPNHDENNNLKNKSTARSSHDTTSTTSPSTSSTDFSKPPSSSPSPSTPSMLAIGITNYGPITQLTQLTLPKPSAPTNHDLLISVRGSSVNPIDTKIRAGTYDDYQTTDPPDPTAYFDSAPPLPHVLGYDCSGVIEAAGPEVRNFQRGDAVFFSNDPRRQGSNAQYTVVDARCAARKPEGLDFVEAASMPLTWVTAWEALVERLGIAAPSRSKHVEAEDAGILIVNGAGGVGSLATQIAAKILRLPVVISTASRAETQSFCREMGATHVVDHHGSLPDQIRALELGVPIKYIFLTSRTEQYLPVAAQISAPFGKVCSIVQTREMGHMYGTEWMAKSLTFVWELIGTKVVYEGELEGEERERCEGHGRILERLRAYVEDGTVVCHMNHQLPATEAGVRRAHELQEEGRVIGKIGIGRDGAEGQKGFEESIY